jgi:murein hydrolase activator
MNLAVVSRRATRGWANIVCAGSALALALVAFGSEATAQANPDDARRRLDANRRQLTEQDQRAGELQSELARLKEDREALNGQLLQTAKLIQASEAQMSAIEQRIGELEAQEKLVRGSLDNKRGSMSGLLAAMQRIGRNPPPVMITRREDALAMVRSAMLIGSAFPELRMQANALAEQLNDLVRVMANIRSEGDKLRIETERLTDARTRLVSLMETKKQSQSSNQAELAQVKKASAELKQNVTDLADFITKLDKTVAEKTRLGDYEKKLAAEAAKQAANPSPTPGPVIGADVPPKQVATVDIKVDQNTVAPPPRPAAAKTKDEPRASVVLAPGDRIAMASPGRIEPSIPFQNAKGRLPLPAQGRRVVSYGDKTQRGPFQGIAIETRFGAQVTSPADGWVVYAGEFRSYGQILIINAGGGYHILLANMSQIDSTQGQFVLAGEPVGTMAPAPKGASSRSQEGAPLLYIEFKKDQKSIDPDPWWAEAAKKNAGLSDRNVIVPQFPPG